MEAAWSSEMLLSYYITAHSEDHNLNLHFHKNFKSHKHGIPPRVVVCSNTN